MQVSPTTEREDYFSIFSGVANDLRITLPPLRIIICRVSSEQLVERDAKPVPDGTERTNVCGTITKIIVQGKKKEKFGSGQSLLYFLPYNLYGSTGIYDTCLLDFPFFIEHKSTDIRSKAYKWSKSRSVVQSRKGVVKEGNSRW